MKAAVGHEASEGLAECAELICLWSGGGAAGFGGGIADAAVDVFVLGRLRLERRRIVIPGVFEGEVIDGGLCSL